MKFTLKLLLAFILFVVLTAINLLSKKMIESFSKKEQILFISNDLFGNGHLEILESLIVKNHEIIKKKIDFDKIYILSQTNDKSFITYIENKYPTVSVIKDKENIKYDYFINGTINPDCGKNKYDTKIKGVKTCLPIEDLKKKNHYYISHKVNKQFNNTNTFYLTPLCNSNNYIMADVLPFTENKTKIDYPVFLIIGHSTMRNNNILEEILDKYDNHNKKFLIKYMSRKAPKLKKKYNNLKICKNYDFVNFHKEILDCHCMLMLISKSNQPQYYKYQLTSSINYIIAYKMKAIIDQELKGIYNLNDSDCYIYNSKDKNSIINQFEKVIEDFNAENKLKAI